MKIKYLSVIFVRVLFILSVTAQSAEAQEKSKALAYFGKETISSDEYVNRYELSPHPGTASKPDSLKKEFLLSMISEKLWAMEARNIGLDSQESFTSYYKPLEKMLVRDALFDREVGSRISISKDDIRNAQQRSQWMLKVYILSSRDSAKIGNAWSELRRGVKIDSLITIDSSSGKAPVYIIRYGQMDDEKVENVIFSLKPGSYSQPVRTKDGWFVFYMLDKTKTNLGKEEAHKNSLEAKMRLKERRAKAIGIKYLDKLFEGKNVRINRELFKLLGEKILRNLSAKEAAGGEKNLYLSESDILNIKKTISADTLNMPIAYQQPEPLTFREFLSYLILNGFSVPDRGRVFASLKYKADRFIEDDLLAREGYRLGLDKLPAVRKDLKQWQDSYLAQLLRNQRTSGVSVSDEEIREYYAHIKASPVSETQVQVMQIVTDSLEVVEKIFSETDKGTSFEELVKKYNRYPAENTGRLVAVSSLSEMGNIAAKMKPGEIYGPMKAEHGYAVIKLIEKKDTLSSPGNDFENEKETLRAKLLNGKMEKEYNGFTSELATKYNLKINDSALKNIRTTDIQMFTYRYIGFGGALSAVPYTTPCYDWIRQWKNKKKENL